MAMSLKNKVLFIVIFLLVAGGAAYFGSNQYWNYQSQKVEKERLTEERLAEEKLAAENEKLLLEKEREAEKAEQDLKIEELKKQVNSLKDRQAESANEQQPDQSNEITSDDLQPYLDGIVLVRCNNSKGSGTLWKFGGQYSLLTNYHVVKTPYSDGRCDVMLLDRTTGNLKGAYTVYSSTAKEWNIYTDIALLELSRSASWDAVMSSPSAEISSLNFKISSIPNCQNKMPIGAPVVVIGYPAFGEKQYTTQAGGESLSGEQSNLIVSNGVISGYDSTVVQPIGDLPYPNYFISAKIDSGNSGGMAFSKTVNGLCILGLPTWLTLGNYETQGLVQNIQNVFYQR
jgi:hypothetical protein